MKDEKKDSLVFLLIVGACDGHPDLSTGTSEPKPKVNTKAYQKGWEGVFGRLKAGDA